jgi:hypothetical protein
MRTRSIVILITLCTAGVFSLTDPGLVRAQTAPEAQGLEVKATGTGTAGRIVRWLTETSQGNSVLFQNAGKIGIGTTTPEAKLTVVSGSGTAVIGTSTSGRGVIGISRDTHGVTGTSTNQVGVRGTSTNGRGVWGTSISSEGVIGESTNGPGVIGTSISGRGVIGTSRDTHGVTGTSTNQVGVRGTSTNGRGVWGTSLSFEGVIGQSTDGHGVVGSSINGLAGFFDGNVEVTGNLTKGAGAFKIDHPLDPENKYLSHSFVESPDMKNIYDGTIMLNAQGQATVHLPAYFSALNKDFRYQLTAVGAPGPNLHIATEIANNRFTIAGGSVGQKVSWQVTGIRQDAYANANRIVVEEDKSAQEQGFFLHPAVFGEPEEQGIQWANRPEAMRQMQAERTALEAGTLSPEESFEAKP